MVLSTQRLGNYLDKIIGFSGKSSNLISKFNTEYAEILNNTGTIGGLLKFALTIIDEVHKHLQGDEKRAFSQLLHIMIESAEFSIDNSRTMKSFDLENEDFIRDLLSAFIENKSEWYPQIYAVDIPLVQQFENRITKNLEQNNYQDSFAFREKFEGRMRQVLEDKDSARKKYYPELDNYLNKLEQQNHSSELFDYLQFVQKKAYDENKIDGKSLHAYYIENDAYIVPIEYWKESDVKEIPKGKRKKWDIRDFLEPTKKNGQQQQKQQHISQRHIVIGAEFGIGKSSYSKYLASKLADNYIYGKKEFPEYIPVLVDLKHTNRVYDPCGGDLDSTLDLIAGNDKGRKILCIYDGFDEYEGDRNSFYEEYIKNKIAVGPDKYKRLKFIITTRLESEYPKFLNVDLKEDTFVRLFPFQNEDTEEVEVTKQTDAFFTKYGISLEFDILRRSIREDVLSKPLFCWMIAYTFQHDKNLVYEKKLSPALIYLSCFHSIIKGKHMESIRDSSFDLDKQHIKEKSILRKIAALKQIYGDSLTYEIAREKIKKFGTELSQDYDKVFGDIVSSYFYSDSGEKSERKIEFMHKSFREFFLAEYFIESIIADKPHRLNVGLDLGNISSGSDIAIQFLYISSGSDIAIQFLNDLLKIIVTKSQGNSNGEVYSLFIDSLRSKYNIRNNDNKSIVDTIIDNSKSIVEREIFVYRPNSYDDNKSALTLESTKEEIWAIKKLTKNDYHEMFQHRWISIYCLTWTFYYKHDIIKNNLQEQQKYLVFNNKNNVSDFIRFSSHLAMPHLKSLIKSNLSNANLSKADLSDANLSSTNLSSTNLSSTNLSNANLFDANLSNANLSSTNLSNAKLSSTNLSNAKLSNANLSSANLSNANLSSANLSNANLSSTNLSGANLSNANLSSTNLSGAHLYESLIINIERFDNLTLNQHTIFNDSLTDMPEFIKYVKSQVHVPGVSIILLKDKWHLRSKLKFRGYPDDLITNMVEHSKLTK